MTWFVYMIVVGFLGVTVIEAAEGNLRQAGISGLLTILNWLWLA